MKHFFVIFSVFFFFLGAALANEDQKIAIGNVTVITMNGDEVLENAVVIINSDRIGNVIADAEIRLSGEVTYLDGTGKYLIPGLAEMHGHIPNASNINQDLQDLLFLYVSQGVTTVRGMLGNAGQFELRDKINAGEVLGPTLYLGGPSFNGNSVSSPAQARQMVRDQAAAGWDFLKIHPGLTRAEYDAMTDEATKLGITWGGHVPANVGLQRALEAGQATIDHLDGYDQFGEGDDRDRIIELTIESGVAVVATNHLWETLMGLPTKVELEAMDELKYISQTERASNRQRYRGQRSGNRLAESILDVENRNKTLKALSDAGAMILLGSDAPQLYSVPGFSIHREMQNMVDAGLTPKQVLYSGTAAVGAFFSDKDNFGQIAPGQRADLILLDANPLDDIANMQTIAGVMVNGKWLSRKEIDEKLAEIEARNAGSGMF